VLISIVMPCRNAEQYIGEAIESALDQEGVDLELVIQDGASDDRTLDVVRSYDDPRIRLESRPDGGQSEALNRSIARASGDWIMWLNADDLITPGSLAQVVPSLEEPFDLVYGDYGVVDSQGTRLNRLSSSPLSVARILSGSAWVFSGSWFLRPRLIERVGPFEADLHWTMDFDWIVRALEHAHARHVGVEVGRYRIQPEAKTIAMPREALAELWGVRGRHSRGSVGLTSAAVVGHLRTSAEVYSRPVRAFLRERYGARRPKRFRGIAD
jgi:glycosyltransferase involved in cell wall biosynthesis